MVPLIFVSDVQDCLVRIVTHIDRLLELLVLGANDLSKFLY